MPYFQKFLAFFTGCSQFADILVRKDKNTRSLFRVRPRGGQGRGIAGKGWQAVFGYITANLTELSQPEKDRYGEVYCGICWAMGKEASQLSRLGLRYDMAFLALTLLSLYEPEEEKRTARCLTHPLRARIYTRSEIITYTADMNIALAYYKCLDDWNDDKKYSAKLLANAIEPYAERIAEKYPRQCGTLQRCLTELNRLEAEKFQNPDIPAGLFGELMGELFVWREDTWAETLREMGAALGRFIYLMDAVLDAPEDRKKGSYNPTLLLEEQPDWEQVFSLTMARCTAYFEKLPLVQDKALLDNILYSGVWVRYRQKNRKEGASADGSL